jgi:hypothetical protein
MGNLWKTFLLLIILCPNHMRARRLVRQRLILQRWAAYSTCRLQPYALHASCGTTQGRESSAFLVYPLWHRRLDRAVRGNTPSPPSARIVPFTRLVGCVASGNNDVCHQLRSWNEAMP